MIKVGYDGKGRPILKGLEDLRRGNCDRRATNTSANSTVATVNLPRSILPVETWRVFPVAPSTCR